MKKIKQFFWKIKIFATAMFMVLAFILLHCKYSVQDFFQKIFTQTN